MHRLETIVALNEAPKVVNKKPREHQVTRTTAEVLNGYNAGTLQAIIGMLQAARKSTGQLKPAVVPSLVRKSGMRRVKALADAIDEAIEVAVNLWDVCADSAELTHDPLSGDQIDPRD